MVNMAINIKCRKCEAKFSIKDAAAGRRVKCRRCGAAIKVPVPRTDEEQLLDFDADAYGDEPSGDHSYGEAAAPETNVSAVSPLRKIISAVVLCVLAIVLIIEVRAGLGHMWSGNMLQENSPSGRFDNLSLAEFEPMLSFAPSRSLVREINGEIEYKYSWFSLLRPLLSRPEAAYYVIVSTTTPPHVRRFNTEPLTNQDLVGAAAAIWNLGGEVELDAKTGEVVAITLPGHQITYEGLEHLKGLTSLRTLWLSGPQVPDAGLEHVKGLTSLKKFSLINTRITDAGLVHLKGLTSLTDLELDSPNITDAGLEHLKGLTSLTHLHLRNSNVTDAGLAELKAALPKCKVSGP